MSKDNYVGRSSQRILKKDISDLEHVVNTYALCFSVSDADQETCELIREAFVLLSEREREALGLLIEDYTFRQAARRMGVELRTFTVFVERARKKVRSHVEQNRGLSSL